MRAAPWESKNTTRFHSNLFVAVNRYVGFMLSENFTDAAAQQNRAHFWLDKIMAAAIEENLDDPR